MQKALFLDRDGIINIDHGYVHTIETFEFSKGIFELLSLFQSKGYLLFILTNQSGIGRGYYTQEAFNHLTTWMLGEFKKRKIHILEVQHCPHTPETHCTCRKPQTGMVDTLLKNHSINLKQSWMIGDKQSDINLALNANIAQSIGIGTTTFGNATVVFDNILSCYTHFSKHHTTL